MQLLSQQLPHPSSTRCYSGVGWGGGTLRQQTPPGRAPRTPRQQQHQPQPQQLQQQRCAGVSCASSKKEAVLSPDFLTQNPVGRALSGVVGTPLFVAIEIVSLLVILALTDAAYSGDWSRIGVIPKDVEPLLQKITIIAWALHGVCGYAASNIARSKGRSAGSAAVKGVLFGSLHVFEELVLPAEDDAAAVKPPQQGSKLKQQPGRRS